MLACGAELKSTFCLAKGRRAWVCHHIGDLENYETLRSFTEGIEHFWRLFAVEPEVVAHDLHPEYLSTKYALGARAWSIVGVQHHHAHIASCLADNGEAGAGGRARPSTDRLRRPTAPSGAASCWSPTWPASSASAIWCPCPCPGGAAAIREPWRMAALATWPGDEPPSPLPSARSRGPVGRGAGLARTGTASPLTSSAGRLFDAVAALCGRAGPVNYEGQAAVELEQRADPDERGAYPMTLDGSAPLRLARRATDPGGG